MNRPDETAFVKRAATAGCRTRRHLIALCAALALGAPACADDNGTTDDDLAGVTLFAWDEAAGRPRGPRPFFSFFVTTQVGLFSLGAGKFAPAPDPVLGYGGDLGGIAGADEICGMLAQRSNPGDTKVWRAFLSTTGNFGAARENAIE